MTTDHTDTSIGVLLERFATDACNKNLVVDLSICIQKEFFGDMYEKTNTLC